MPTPPIPYPEIVETARAWCANVGAASDLRVAPLTVVAARMAVSPKVVQDRLDIAVALGIDVPGWREPRPGARERRHQQYRAADPHYPGYWRREVAPYDPDDEPEDDQCLEIAPPEGVILAFSDAHWAIAPQRRTLAHEALLRAAKVIQPAVLLSIGDLLDLEAPSKHDPLGWNGMKASVQDGLYAAQAHLQHLQEAAPNALRLWVRGNHDDRFDKKLAKVAPEFEGVAGTALTEHFAGWRMAHRLRIGTDVVVVHGQRGGIHAGWNNLADNGCTTVSGHTHMLEVKPRQFEGRRAWAVQTGMLGDPRWPQFRYRAGAPGQQRMGFAVLTWRGGVLQPPELVECVNGAAWFRGEPIAGRVRVKAWKP